MTPLVPLGIALAVGIGYLVSKNKSASPGGGGSGGSGDLAKAFISVHEEDFPQSSDGNPVEWDFVQQVQGHGWYRISGPLVAPASQYANQQNGKTYATNLATAMEAQPFAQKVSVWINTWPAGPGTPQAHPNNFQLWDPNDVGTLGRARMQLFVSDENAHAFPGATIWKAKNV